MIEKGDLIIENVSADDLSLATYAGLAVLINELIVSNSIDGSRLAALLQPLTKRESVPPGAQGLISDLAEIARDSHNELQRARGNVSHGSD